MFLSLVAIRHNTTRGRSNDPRKASTPSDNQPYFISKATFGISRNASRVCVGRSKNSRRHMLSPAHASAHVKIFARSHGSSFPQTGSQQIFFFHGPFSRRNPARGPSAQTTAAEKSTKSRAIQPHGGRRLGREGGSASCAAPRRSLKSKGSPSTLAVCARGRERRLAARARAAA